MDTGRTPDTTNLPGGNYITTDGGGGDGNISGNQARMHNGGGVGVALGTYNDAATLKVTSDIYFQNTTAPVQTSGYAQLGVFNAASTGQYQSATAKFTGLQVNLDGSLQLYLQGIATGSPVAFGGTYSPASIKTLTFTVNTTTGALTDVSFGDSTTPYAFVTTGFTEARTEYFGIAGSLNNSANYSVFDNLLLETAAVPEPASIGLLAIGAVTALRRLRTA